MATHRQLGFKDNILMIEIKINTDALQSTLNTIAQRTSNTQPLMTQLARIMRNAVLDNFEAGGRPAWAPRKYPSAREGSGLLQASGRLRNSITQNSTATEAVVGTNVEYAAIHNFGGQTAPHTILPKNGKALKFGGRFAKRVNHPGSKIPARPFMVLQPDDEQALVDAVNDYLDAALGN